MRFRARVINVELFSKIVQTVEKIGRECVIHFNTNKIEFILTSDITEGVQVWSGMNIKSLFEDYRIESMNNNEISFEIHLDNLSRALKSAQFAQEVTMKLSKKGGMPILSVFIETQSTQVMTIIQEIPITLLSAGQLAMLTEPVLPDPEVYIMMPPLKLVQKVVDRMKNMSDYLKIEANMAGQLVLSIETDVVTVSTFYKNLEHPQIRGKDVPQHNPDIQCAVKVDIKKFSRFLFSHLVGPNNVICCLVENKAVILYVLLDDLYMTYYIPVLLH